MSYTVLAQGYINANRRIPSAIKKRLEEAMVPYRGEVAIRVGTASDYIEVDASGNKGVDYSFLVPIIDILKKADLDIDDIAFGEYAETGDGYFYGHGDDQPLYQHLSEKMGTDEEGIARIRAEHKVRLKQCRDEAKKGESKKGAING